MLWSTRSKALEYSNCNTLLMFILSAWRCQWYSISTRACVVEEPFKPPNWSLPIWWPTISHSHSPTIDSMTFDKTGVSEIGCRSHFMSYGGLTLGRFITLALFQSIGKKPSRSELLNIAHIGWEITLHKSCKIQLGIESGPRALKILIWANFLCFPHQGEHR